MREGAPTVLMVLAVGLAGCLGGLPGPEEDQPARAADVVRQAGVEDPTTVVVDVTYGDLPGADPVANATVVFFTKFYADDLPNNPGATYYQTVEDRCDELHFDEEPFWTLAVGTTGADGRLIGEVDPGALNPGGAFLPINVAVGGVPGWTTEGLVWTLETLSAACGLRTRHGDLPTLPDGTGHLRIPLYPERIPVDIHGRLGPTVPVPEVLSGERSTWFPHTVPDPDAVRRRYGLGLHDRIRRVDATLRWDNGDSGWADLYLGAGYAGTSRPDVVGNDTLQGPHETGNEETLDAAVVPHPIRPLAVGPVTDQPVVTPWSIGYGIEGSLGIAGTTINLLPGPEDAS